MSTENTPPQDPDGTIPVDVAREWAANWRTYLSTSNQDFITRSFTLPIIDFKNILLYNPDAESVRAFIGLESATDPLSAKLILVPIVDGKEILVTLTNNLGDAGTSNVYDLSKACPPQCAITTSDDTLDA